MVALFVLMALLLFLTIDHFVQRALIRAQAMEPVRTPVRTIAPALDLFVSPGHAWARLEPTGTLRVGADAFPALLLGNLERIEVAAPGTALRRGEPLATLASGDRRVVLRAPFDATVAARNEALEPNHAATDPFGHGWLARLTPKATGTALGGMHFGEEAVARFREELGRLRDSLVAATATPAGATLTDGGEPAPGAAAALLEPDAFVRLSDEFFAVPAISMEAR